MATKRRRRRRRSRIRIGRLLILIIGIIVIALGLFFGVKKVISIFTKGDDIEDVDDDYDTDKNDKNKDDKNKDDQDDDTDPGVIEPVIEYLGTVVIDAGHGGDDRGYVSGEVLEKDVTLQYALKLGKILESQNVKVIYTREKDVSFEQTEYIEPISGIPTSDDSQARIDTFAGENVDYFISLHVGSSDNGLETGHTIYCVNSNKESISLAAFIDKRLAHVDGIDTNGIKNATNMRVLTINPVTAVEIDLGYMNTDAEFLNSKKGMSDICNTIANGIVAKLEYGPVRDE